MALDAAAAATAAVPTWSKRPSAKVFPSRAVNAGRGERSQVEATSDSGLGYIGDNARSSVQWLFASTGCRAPRSCLSVNFFDDFSCRSCSLVMLVGHDHRSRAHWFCLSVVCVGHVCRRCLLVMHVGHGLVVGHACRSCVSVMLVGHARRSCALVLLAGHACRPYLRVTIVRHACRSYLSVNFLVGLDFWSCVTVMFVCHAYLSVMLIGLLFGHVCRSCLSAMLVGYDCQPCVSVMVIRHFSRRFCSSVRCVGHVRWSCLSVMLSIVGLACPPCVLVRIVGHARWSGVFVMRVGHAWCACSTTTKGWGVLFGGHARP